MATVVLTFEAKGKVIIKVIIYVEVRHYAYVASWPTITASQSFMFSVNCSIIYSSLKEGLKLIKVNFTNFQVNYTTSHHNKS